MATLSEKVEFEPGQWKFEIATVISGFISSFPSGLEVFFGNAWKESGPRYAFIIVVVWVALFLWLLLQRFPVKEETKKKNPILAVIFLTTAPKSREIIHSAVEVLENSGNNIDKENLDKREGLKENKSVNSVFSILFLTAWIITVCIWGRGVYLHESQAKYLNVKGLVRYGLAAIPELKNKPIANVDIVIDYNNKPYFTKTDNNGFYKTLLNIESDVAFFKIAYKKKGLKPFEKNYIIDEKKYLYDEVFLELGYQ